jgi:hypothetical protein
MKEDILEARTPITDYIFSDLKLSKKSMKTKESQMKKVKVENRLGVTTSVIPYRNGTYPVWFEDSDTVEFIEVSKVVFI